MATICRSRSDLLHCVAKGSVVTWRLAAGNDPVELSDLNVPGIAGTIPRIIVPHPSWLVIYAVGKEPEKGSKKQAEILVLSLTSQRVVQTWSGHAEERSITELLWVEALGQLVSGSNDGTCRLWDLGGRSREVYSTGRMKKGFLGDPPEPEEVTQMAVHLKSLFVGNKGGAIDVVDLDSGTTTRSLLPVWLARYKTDVPAQGLELYEAEKRKNEARLQRKRERRARGEDSDDPEDDEEKPVWGAGDPTDKSVLARRAGEHDNQITRLVVMEGGGSVAATTIGGEVLMVSTGEKQPGSDSLMIFEKSYGGCLAVGTVGGRQHVFSGNRGYDAKRYELVILSTDPLTQLQRVEFEGNSMLTKLHWSSEAANLFVANEDKGLFRLDMSSGGIEQQPIRVFEAEEDRDTMDNEEILGLEELPGQLCARTTFGRVRRFAWQGGGAVEEVEPLAPKRIGGLQGRAKLRVDRATGILMSLRSGYDEYKLDTAGPGDGKWTRHNRFPMRDGSGREVEVVKDGDPSGGMGYAGKYQVQDQDGATMTLNRDEMGGLMHLKKGWGPSFLEYLESPAGSMFIVGGELGGMIQYAPPTGDPALDMGEAPPPAADGAGAADAGQRTAWVGRSFEGGRLVTGCDVSIGLRACCAAWDAEGTLILATSNSASWVYHWESRKHHADLKQKGLAEPRRVQLDGSRALAAAWQKPATGEEQRCSKVMVVIDLRSTETVARLALDRVEIPHAFVSVANGLFFGTSLKDAKATSARLGAWSVAQELRSAGASAELQSCSMQVDMGDTEKITSMVLLDHVGLLTAHATTPDGISVWDPDTGGHLFRVWPTQVGSAYYIHRGPGESILWTAVGGEVGYLMWNRWTSQLKVAKAEDGAIKHGFKDLGMFAFDAGLFASSKYQLASFCLPYVPSRLARRLGETAAAAAGSTSELMPDMPWPSLFSSPPVQWAAEVGAVLRWGMHIHVPYFSQFVAASGAVLCFASIFLIQEAVEARAFLSPTSLWPKAFMGMNFMVKGIVAVATLPLFTIFVLSAPCDGEVLVVDEEIECGGHMHMGFMALAAAMVALLTTFTVRYLRVDQELKNIDMSWNPFDVSGDVVPTTRTPKHMMSAMSRTYALGEVGIKYAFKLVKRFCGVDILGASCNIIVSLVILKLSLTTDPVPVRRKADWLHLNEMLFALKVSVFWIFVIWLLAASISAGYLQIGPWFNWTPLPLLLLAPLAMKSRHGLQKSVLECWRRRGSDNEERESAADSAVTPLLATAGA